jgi:hypothetical protein
MNETRNRYLESLTALARSTRAAAPRPVSPAVLRILAGRRRAERASRRLLAAITMVSMAPIAISLVAWALDPALVVPVRLMSVALALGTALVISGVARVAGATSLHQWRS